MEITRTSILTGVTRTMDLDVTAKQLWDYETGGKYLQEAFGHLGASEREFIKSGITNEEWCEHFDT